MSFEKDFLRLVGIIIKPHGLRGEVSCKTLTDYPKSFFSGEVLFLDEEKKEQLVIEMVKQVKVKGKDGLFIKFEGIDDIDSAKTFSQRSLFRKASCSPKIKEDQFWIDEVIGCSVYSPDLTLIGKVQEVLSGSSNDNLVILTERETDQNKEGTEMIVPLVEDYIHEIDICNKKIILKTVPEYF
jgi:16S rRNA processing protein RimM